MSAEGTGATSSLRIKSQTAVDTLPTTGMRSVPFTKITPRHSVVSRTASKHLGPLAAVSARYYGPIKRELDFECELGYTTLDDVLSAIVGAPSVSGDGAATAYANLYTPAATPPYKYIQVVEGDIPTTKGQGYKNCIVPSVVISYDAANPLGSVVAKIEGQLSTATPGSGETLVSAGLVTVSHVPILNTHWTVYNQGVGTDTGYCVRSLRINLTRERADDRACLGASALKAPAYKGPLDASYDMVIEFDDPLVFAAFEAQTVLTGFRLKAVGAATGIGSDNYTLEVRSSKALIPQWELPIEDNGKITQRYTVEGYGNAGSGLAYEAFAAQLTNNVDGSTL